MLPGAPAPLQPIFLLGCPRSGTSVLFSAMRKSRALGALPGEGHVLWEEYGHPRYRDWESNALGPADVSDREREYLFRLIHTVARGRRYMDKTPKNCLRIPYLRALFPDAYFVFLRRRGADNVNSLIEGWRAHPRFVTYRLPEPLEGLDGIDGRDWSFVLVPGWRELRQAPLEEICAAQYIACNEAALAAREQVDPEHWIDVVYEDFVASPRAELGRVFERLGLDFDHEVATFADSLDRTPINVVTPPKRDKWRTQNREEIERILPLIAGVEERLGYGADSSPESLTAASPSRNGPAPEPAPQAVRPRDAHPDLDWVANIFGSESLRFRPASRSSSTSSAAEQETFAVFPRASRPHLLVPVASRRAAAAALTGYTNVHDASGSIRFAKALFALGLRAGVGGVLLSDRVSLARADGAANGEPPRLNLKPHLEEVLGRGDLEFAVRIGTMRPNRKPLLQILTRSGECLGFAKVGWNDLTRELVRNEARVLRSFADGEFRPTTFAVPRLAYAGSWNDLEILVVSPLANGHWWKGVVARDLPIETTREISELQVAEPARLGDSDYWRSSATRAAAIEGRGGEFLLHAIDELGGAHGETVLRFGSSHGDWAPWNMRRVGSRLAVWDWERSGAIVPWGLDALHWLFHVELKVRGRSPRRAASEVLRQTRTVGEALDLEPDRYRLLLQLALLEMSIRFAEARTAGIELEDRIYMPLLADLLAREARAEARRAAA